MIILWLFGLCAFRNRLDVNAIWQKIANRYMIFKNSKLKFLCLYLTCKSSIFSISCSTLTKIGTMFLEELFYGF